MKQLHKVRVFFTIMLLWAFVACAPTPNSPSTPSVVPTLTATPPTCQPSPTQPSNASFPEVQAAMKSEGEIWALLFFDQAQAKTEAKIVWRVTGDGPFQVQAQHEDGTIVQPIWGPEIHGGSNWKRPGEEWGTGFNFPKPGCWTLTATRGTLVGEVRLNVIAP